MKKIKDLGVHRASHHSPNPIPPFPFLLGVSLFPIPFASYLQSFTLSPGKGKGIGSWTRMGKNRMLSCRTK